MKSGPKPQALYDRILERVALKNECWIWQNNLDRSGYGTLGFCFDGKHVTKFAHRVSYETFVGKIPAGMVIDHLCRNPACVNPSHLEPVTHLENVRRGESGLRNRIKTHCSSGHPLLGENLYMNGAMRVCKICNRAAGVRYRLRIKGRITA